ncbi:MAG: ABC transporter substrate-binding protein [Solirubrobacterales bacterium]
MPARRLGISLFLLMLGAGALAGCGGTLGDAAGSFDPSHPGTLTVITQPLPTTGFWEGTDRKPTGGFEYGMALALADRLGIEQVDVRTMPFSRIVTGRLVDGDVAMALITPTDEREEVLEFSTPYFNSPPALLVRAGTEVPDVQTAQELQWAVGRNTTFEDIVAAQIHPDSEPLRYESRTVELAALRSGKVDVAMFDLPAAQALVTADPSLEVAAKLSQTEPIAIALPNGSENVEAISSAVRAMLSDGTLDELAERWLGGPIEAGEDAVPLLRTAGP